MSGSDFPLGSSVTLAELTQSPYDVLAKLQAEEPVSWVPALGAWLVTDRDLVIEAMRDAERFTVDDPRFSTAAVLGPSMLSLDGPEHQRHRAAFANHFRPRVVRDQFEEWMGSEANRLVAEFAPARKAELRTSLEARWRSTPSLVSLGCPTSSRRKSWLGTTTFPPPSSVSRLVNRWDAKPQLPLQP